VIAPVDSISLKGCKSCLQNMKQFSFLIKKLNMYPTITCPSPIKKHPIIFMVGPNVDSISIKGVKVVSRT
jgi:hypothetical protein